MGVEQAERTVEIAAPPGACYEAALDFESYPEWQSAVVECHVRERDAEGRGSLVETVVDARVRQIRYVLSYTHEPPHRMRWTLVEGDPKSVDGEYAFEPAGDGTLVTYRLAVDIGRVGMLVPGDVRRKATEHLMRSSVEELRARVEGG